MKSEQPQPIVVHIDEPRRPPLTDPCLLGRHQWAHLTAGGQACYRCGRRR